MHHENAPRTIQTFRHSVAASPKEIFPLLCPVREYDWIESWACTLIYAATGVAELGCVFTTDLPEEGEETWVCSRYEPDTGISYVRVNPALCAGVLDIDLQSTGQETQLTWVYTATALTRQGVKKLATATDEDFQKRMDFIAQSMQHYLATGTMLRMQPHAGNK